MKYVAGFLFNSTKTHIALVTKNRPAWQAGKLNAIGGKIEGNEPPLDAMIREFKEETGATVTAWREFCVLTGTDWQVHMFVATGNYEIKTIESEPIAWHEISSIDFNNTISNLKWLVPLALDPETIYGTLHYTV